ncbi:integration host factor subunit alpha [Trinickia caryophylli]|uniref:Integration host factor subunit alpha n=2 Tax=Trinickia caryophylli TaxID=28094 RepID=A0A1X7CNN0_TRICW|nr:integration host factor subunit alpha [Trinickia caryophylli]SME99833.1 integration host factor subunit alpha [Trinickia caryophylli]
MPAESAGIERLLFLDMNEMNSSDFEALLSAQRGAMIREIPTPPASVSTETPTLTKAELAELLFDNVGLNKREAKDMVEAFFDVIRDALESGDSVKLSGFGNFQLRDKPQRPGRNPKTGEAIPIAARRVVTFHASQKLKALVENGAEASFPR